MHLAYWAISLANKDSIGKPKSLTQQKNKKERKEDHQHRNSLQKLIKQFIYMFIIDCRISPFVKIYKERDLTQACVEQGRFEILKELLQHTYVLHSK